MRIQQATRHSLVAALMIMGATSSFAATPQGAASSTSKPTAAERVREGAYDLLDVQAVSITFKEGQATLSEADKSKVKALVNAVRKDAPIKEVAIGGWSDQDYHAGDNSGLTKADKKLAADRVSAVKNYVKSIGVKDTKTFNFAENPNWLEKKIATEEAVVKSVQNNPKKAYESQKERNEAQLGREFKKDGGASKVVVVVGRAVKSGTAH